MTSLVDSLNEKSHHVLNSLLLPGQRCALLDLPATANWGDHAIWMGERAVLSAVGVKLVYESDDALFDVGAMRRRLGPDGVVLLHGGGSLGDLYPPRQRFREMVLRTIRDLPIVQLPQSIHFQDDSQVSPFARLVREHPRFTLLARDVRSQRFAEERLTIDAALCPDLAFAMGHLDRLGQPTHEVLWLDRKGPEAIDRQPLAVPDTVLRTDWLPPRRKGVTSALDLVPGAADHQFRKLRRRFPDLGPVVDPARRWLLPHVGPAKVRSARRFLSQGSAVITDRLHGHVLCLLMDIPHVLLENRIGKLRDFYRTWTSTSPIAQFASSESVALELAQDLARTGQWLPDRS